jgi:hypothetical protein
MQQQTMVESNNYINNSHRKNNIDIEVLTVCLTAGRKRVIVSCPARTVHHGSSIARTGPLSSPHFTALQMGAATACNGNDNGSISSSSTTDIELHVDGFPQPRRTLTTHDVEWMCSQSLYDVGIRRQDRILVTLG